MVVEAVDLDCEVEVSEGRLSLWPELFWGLEWLQLRWSPLYRGQGVTAGHGEPVVLVPGFLASDASLGELRGWLERIGYRAIPSGIGRNSDCPDVLLEDILRTAEGASAETGQRVRLIGHSLGGTLARAVAVRRPDLVAQVITLGSPVREVTAHPLVLGIARLMGRVTPSPSQRPRRHGDHVHDATCACDLVEALAKPFPKDVTRASIFSRRDGVVDWRSCLDEDPTANVEVHGSHLGLLVNLEAYGAVARLLAAVPGNLEGAPAPVPHQGLRRTPKNQDYRHVI
ncbi:MAG TPA: hypothetical protein VLS25_02655 [Dehalococcoidia bacterium]|nr:hypothetical protein [Dehalococcoidia bacterium]